MPAPGRALARPPPAAPTSSLPVCEMRSGGREGRRLSALAGRRRPVGSRMQNEASRINAVLSSPGKSRNSEADGTWQLPAAETHWKQAAKPKEDLL